MEDFGLNSYQKCQIAMTEEFDKNIFFQLDQDMTQFVDIGCALPSYGATNGD